VCADSAATEETKAAKAAEVTKATAAALAAFKDAMSHLAAGVVIVTTSGPDDTAFGMTATAVCSVSLDPPLVMACMNHQTATHRAVESSAVFALNLLPAGEEGLARRFASKGEDKFAGIDNSPRLTGAPILHAALAYCDCSVERSVSAGDHTIFIGRVLDAGVSSPEGVTPLLYFRGDYGSAGPLEEKNKG